MSIPRSWRENPFDTEAAFGDTGPGHIEDDETVTLIPDPSAYPREFYREAPGAAWRKEPAPNAVEVSNRREPEPIEVGRQLSDFKAMERDALNKMHAEARAALESVERVLEGLNLLRAATQNHRQLVTGLRDLVETIEGMRSVFNRTLDRDTQTL